MKKRLEKFGILGAVTLSCIMLSCAMPAEPSAEAGYGTVSISFASGPERTVLPAKTFRKYKYEFTPAAEAPETTSHDKTVFTLKTGPRSVVVKAYVNNDDNEGDYAAISASTSFTVTQGEFIPVTVDLTGTTTGEGTFAYNIEYPGITLMAGKSTFELRPLTYTLDPISGESNTREEDNILTANDVNFGVSPLTGTKENVPAGFYLATINLRNSLNEKAGKTEVVHIYKNMTTNWGTAFDPNDFVGEPLGGTVNITSNAPGGSLTLPAVHDTLTATWAHPTGVQDENPTGVLTYEWRRHSSPSDTTGTVIPNATGGDATGSDYTLLPADIGKWISVMVQRTGNNPGTSSILIGPVKMSFESGSALQTWLSQSAPTQNTATTPYEVVFTGTLSALRVTDANLNGRYVSIDLSRAFGSGIIPANAFEGCVTLTGVTLPSGITTIKSSAFNGCTNLTAITFPDILNIESNAFQNSGLTEITLPASITRIENHAFNSSSLTRVISNKLTPFSLGSNAFPSGTVIKVPDATAKTLYEADPDWSTYTIETQ
ncbi:MAG: leucine-rich repeat domain-containing protein [Spirochaetaceae bacterium]|jgi:hypothetical protein|nr:leucine-rich repeat domain-containing protein [Spirochaetaceae bacterium]